MTFRSAPIHVFVVARPLLCWGFEKLVHTAYLGIRITGTADTLDDALSSIHQVRADLLVVDHDEYTGSRALQEAAKVIPILLLTSYRRDFDASELVDAQVVSVVSKSDSPATLLRAIEQACERCQHRWAHGRPSAPGRLDDGPDPDQVKISRLTARERELIFALMCSESETGKIVASRLCISEQTLRNHLSSIYGKLGVHSRLGLHAFAVKHGLDRTTQ